MIGEKKLLFYILMVKVIMLIIRCSENNLFKKLFTTKDQCSIKDNPSICVPYEGQWIRIKNKANHLCIKNVGEFQKIRQNECFDTDDHLWKFQKNTDGTYFILSRKRNGVLSLYENECHKECREGEPVFLWEYKGDEWQKWKLIKSYKKDLFLIQHFVTKKCLDNRGLDIYGSSYQVFNCDGDDPNQAFFFSKTDLLTLKGEWVNIVNIAGMCVRNNKKGQGLIQSYCGDADDMLWKVIKDEEDSYKIISRLDGGVIENANGVDLNNNPVNSAENKCDNSQRWEIGYFPEPLHIILVNRGVKKCFDNLGNAKPGISYQILDCVENSRNQGFRFEKPWMDSINLKYWVFIKNIFNGLCIATRQRGDKIVQATCRGLDEFAWFVEKNCDGTVYFVNKSTRDVIENSKGVNANNNPIIGSCHDEKDSKRWKILHSNIRNFFLFESKNTGKCFDNTGFAMANVGYVISDCNEKSLNQGYQFERFKYEKEHYCSHYDCHPDKYHDKDDKDSKEEKKDSKTDQKKESKTDEKKPTDVPLKVGLSRDCIRDKEESRITHKNNFNRHDDDKNKKYKLQSCEDKNEEDPDDESDENEDEDYNHDRNHEGERNYQT